MIYPLIVLQKLSSGGVGRYADRIGVFIRLVINYRTSNLDLLNE